MKCEYHPSVLDHLRRQHTLLEEENKRLRVELARERYARLTLEIEKAIAANDERAYVRLMAEREAA